MLPMKIIITLILSVFLLTSCSNPDTSGGVTLQKSPGEPDAVSESDGGTLFKPRSRRPRLLKNRWPNPKLVKPDPPTYTDEFPHGLCTGPTELGDKSQTTGCGWIHVNRESHYIRPGVTLKWPTLTGANLAGANLSRAYLKLSSRDTTNLNLAGANLSGAVLYGNFKHTNLSGANLSNAKMFNTGLIDSNLRGADLRHAQLGGAVLINADLRGANLFWARLDAGTWLQGVKGDWNTHCPNGARWGTAGNDCRF